MATISISVPVSFPSQPSKVARRNAYVQVAAKLSATSQKLNIEAEEVAALITLKAAQELSPKESKRLDTLYNIMERRVVGIVEYLPL